MRSSFACALLFLAAASRVFAIYEEQAGENDWHAEFIGRTTDVQPFKRDHLIASTALNVLASLSLSSGNVVWRQVLHQTDQLQAFTVLSRPAAVVSLSNASSLLRAWRADDGALLWEKRIQPPSQLLPAMLSTIPEASVGAGESIALIIAGHIQVYSGLKGSLSWQAEPQSTWSQVSSAVVSSSKADQTVVVAGLTDSGVLEMLQLDQSTGNILHQKSYKENRGGSLQSVVLRQDLVFGLTCDGRQLCTATIQDSGVALKCQPWTEFSPALEGPTRPALLPAKSQSSVAVRFDSGVLVVTSSDGRINHSAFVPGATSVSDELSSASGRTLVAAGTTSSGQLQTHTVSLDTAQMSQPTTFQSTKLLNKEGSPIQISNVFLAAGSAGKAYGGAKPSSQPLVGLSAADGSLLLTKGSEVVWQRDEALAEVSAALFVDLPADVQSAERVDSNREKTSIMDHIQSQFLSIKGQLSIIKPEEKLELARLKSTLSDRLMPTRDNNGFRKLLVVLSRAGKLLGLHSGDGHVMWTLNFPQGQAPQRMFPWRSSHDLQKAPELLTLQSSESSSTYSVVDAHTGAELGSGSVNFPVTQVLELPRTLHDATGEQHVFLLIGSQAGKQRAKLLPDSSQARSHLKSLPTDVFFWQEDRAAGSLTGFHIDKQTLSISQLYSNIYSSPGTEVLQLAARDPTEHVYSHAKILGNKSLKIKYLNPSTVFIATGPPAGLLSEDLDSSSMMLTVQIVDTVTGAPIHRQIHKLSLTGCTTGSFPESPCVMKRYDISNAQQRLLNNVAYWGCLKTVKGEGAGSTGCRGPVHAQFVENWVAYHYFDVSNHRWEMSVLELYNKAQGNVTITDMVLGKTSNSMSSYDPVPVEVLRQSYFFDSAVKHMGVSQTMHGISNKFLLIGTLSDQVYTLDKRMLDPRRPVGPPSKDDQLEQLIPYQQTLVMSPLLYATHAKQVAQLSGIATAPANLESTSLMLAYGLDLFFARIQPNQAFDSLTDDFPYAFLVLITLMLTGAVFVLKRIDNKSDVQRKWL